MSTTPTFHAGICMAGAISAGAYTAGVMDYLLEALEHWEKAKQLQSEGKLTGIPKHNFMIDVLGGASAGGMTAAITARGLQDQFAPVTTDTVKNEALAKANPLYNAWVNLKETKEQDMMDLLLNTDDIENNIENKEKEVRAGLNSNFIKDIASDILDKCVSVKYERRYIAKDLDIFTTLTNLRGFSYKVNFKTSSGDRTHHMRMHRDYAFFTLDDRAGKIAGTLPDGRIPVHFSDEKGNSNVLKSAAMGTGAFPVGLESRDLTRKSTYIKSSKYLNLMKGATGTDYTFLPESDDFLSLNVDGGVINNEPYEITEQLLEDRREIKLREEAKLKKAELKKAEQEAKAALGAANLGTSLTEATATEEIKNIEEKEEDSFVMPKMNRSAALFESMVLMIDPFPDDDKKVPEYIPKKAWRNVLPSIITAMRSQLMMKDEQIKRAYLSDDYTRFLIMPERYDNINGVDVKMDYAIACGSLEGFGGFFSKEFRKHDYFLGRRNCQRFLQQHFTVPENAGNPILAYGYKDVKEHGKLTIDVAPGESKKEATLDGESNAGTTAQKTYLCILPDIRVGADGSVYTPPEEKKYDYPAITLSYVLGLKKKIIKRLVTVAKNVGNVEVKEKKHENSIILKTLRKKSKFREKFVDKIADKGVNAYINLALWFGKGTAADSIIDVVIRDLEARGLIEDDRK
ncbi:patatin-like phospholipase family protein [Flavobacterium sp. RHBU_24]|uniref:patatin-like phospholipase family protein n=1 Tax=Flavobacterium sp. RHBU_24 TaxID=3391185 RepID=UPI003984D721